MRSLSSRTARTAMSLATTAILAGAAITQGHVLQTIGDYSVALGWAIEPTYVGAVNAVQVVVQDKAGTPVSDLADGDLSVVVSFEGATSDPFPLLNRFDADTGLGVAGDYEAPLMPTVPGDYTFHLTGSIHGQAVDETATSGESTFDSAVEPTAIQFPTALPALSQILTRLDRIEARLSGDEPTASPSPAP
jgi:hypothetical protein